MKNYLVLYHAPAEILVGSANQTEAEMAKGMEPWRVWAERCGDQLLDMGNPLTGGQKLKPDASAAPSEREVCGYSMLKANSMEEAKELLLDHPHLVWNSACEIEVHEVIPLPGI